MDNLILLGAIVYIILLIVVLCNMKNDKIKFILLLNGIILPLLLYYIFPNNFIEGFNEPKSPKLKALKKQALEIISSDDDDKTKKNKLLLALNKTKQSLTTKEEKQELEEAMKSTSQNKTVEVNIPELPKKNSIQLNKLSKKNKQALEKLYFSAKSKDIEKIFNLDNDTFTTMLNEISNN